MEKRRGKYWRSHALLKQKDCADLLTEESDCVTCAARYLNLQITVFTEAALRIL